MCGPRVCGMPPSARSSSLMNDHGVRKREPLHNWASHAAEAFTRRDPDRPRFVAGSIGPTNKTLSMGVHVEDPGDVDVDDPRVGVRRPQDGRVQHVLADAHVVHVATLAAQEALVLDPLDPFTEQPGGHQRSPGSAAAISAARRTDRTMLV